MSARDNRFTWQPGDLSFEMRTERRRQVERSAKALRLQTLITARAAALRGDHATARHLFAQCGIDYHTATSGN